MKDLATLLSDLKSLEVADFDYKLSPPVEQSSASSGMEKLSHICHQLLKNYKTDPWAEALFHALEKLGDHVDLGSPGVLVHTLEKRSDYVPYLYQSIQRKPTEYALWMACRHMDSPDCNDRKKWIDVIWSVEKSTNASSGAKQFVEDFLLDEGLIE